MTCRWPDQRLDLASERGVVDRAVERPAAFALDDVRELGRAVGATLADEHHVHPMTAGDVAMDALHTLHGAWRVRVAKDERGALHRHSVDQQPERHVDDLVAARAQRREQALGFRRSVAHENQGSDSG